MNVILEGIVGSTAYGLNIESSDIDIKGVYVAPTHEVLSLFPPAETIDQTKPDKTYHPTWAKLVRTFGVDRGECMADVFG